MADQARWVQGRHFRTGEPMAVEVKDGRIAKVQRMSSSAGLPWLGPGLVDAQVNGFLGIDFNTLPLAEESVFQVTEALWREGVTAYLPTVITNSDEGIEEALRSIAGAVRHYPALANTIPGIHLEGPFISPEDGPRGAHDVGYVKAPDWELFERWQKAAEGRIRLVTLSPEWPNAVPFIEKCVKSGVKVSIGHTSASSEQITAAVRAGASMSTHLGNGAHPVLPRHPNYIWDQLAEDELWAAVIADGFHLPDAVLKVIMRVKRSQTILVSDLVYLGGLEPGEYETHIGGHVVLTPAGKLHLANQPQLLAGSVQTLRQGVGNLFAKGLSSLAEAWEMASIRPSSYLGLSTARELTVGEPADLVVFDWDNGIRILQTIKCGFIVFESQDLSVGGKMGCLKH